MSSLLWIRSATTSVLLVLGGASTLLGIGLAGLGARRITRGMASLSTAAATLVRGGQINPGESAVAEVDAAMQALGSYKGGEMLFLGLGTGLGSALVANGVVVPMELAHLPFKRRTYEDYMGLRGLERLGKKKWRKCVEYGVARLIDALLPEDVVIGGGNVKDLKQLPLGCRAGDNANAFVGGFRMWEDAGDSRRSARKKARPPRPRPSRQQTKGA
jgi:hypothetical protein